MTDCLGDTVPAKGVLAGCRRNRIYNCGLTDNPGEVWVNMFNIVIGDLVSHCRVITLDQSETTTLLGSGRDNGDRPRSTALAALD